MFLAVGRRSIEQAAARNLAPCTPPRRRARAVAPRPTRVPETQTPGVRHPRTPAGNLGFGAAPRQHPPSARAEGRGRPTLTSTVAPASSSCFLIFAASSLLTPSLTAFGAASTRSLASLRPRPVMARTSLMTLIFFSPAAARMTSNSVFSTAASAAAPPPPAPPPPRPAPPPTRPTSPRASSTAPPPRSRSASTDSSTSFPDQPC